MKRLLMLLGLLLLTGCTALPAEERSFAVALGMSMHGDRWTAHARIPTYQSGGGYATVSGTGDTPRSALAALDAASPMELQLGQLRLVVFSEETARSSSLSYALEALSARRDLRMDALAAVTEEDMQRLMDALEPATGSRLSKSLDVLAETRIAQGTAPDCTIGDVLRSGERQQMVLANAALEEEAVTLSGGWPMNSEGCVSERFTPEEMRLLALMTGQLKKGTLTLAEGVVRLNAARAEVELSLPAMDRASVRLTLGIGASPLTEDALSHAVATACLGLLGRLSAMGCDALGLGRQAIVHTTDMAEWQALDWPARCRELDWAVSVGVEGTAR